MVYSWQGPNLLLPQTGTLTFIRSPALLSVDVWMWCECLPRERPKITTFNTINYQFHVSRPIFPPDSVSVFPGHFSHLRFLLGQRVAQTHFLTLVEIGCRGSGLIRKPWGFFFSVVEFWTIITFSSFNTFQRYWQDRLIDLICAKQTPQQPDRSSYGAVCDCVGSPRNHDLTT